MYFNLNEMKNEITNIKEHRLSALSFTYQGNNYYYKADKGFEYAYNELIAQKIAERLGVSCCKYYPANYKNTNGVVTKIFDTKHYIPMIDILEKYYSDSSKNYDNENNLEDIWYAFDMMFDEDTTAKLMDELVNIFLFDILIGNIDRHNENIGIIVDDKGVRFAPLFDNESMLDYEAITDGEYCLGIEKGDSFGYNLDPQENLVYKFLKLSDTIYTERLIGMLPVISEKSLKQIFAELKAEGVEIPEEIITDRLQKFAVNRQMIERYFIYNRGVAKK